MKIYLNGKLLKKSNLKLTIKDEKEIIEVTYSVIKVKKTKDYGPDPSMEGYI